jgi:hypothetical protein
MPVDLIHPAHAVRLERHPLLDDVQGPIRQSGEIGVWIGERRAQSSQERADYPRLAQ